jgi:hypothetical protein
MALTPLEEQELAELEAEFGQEDVDMDFDMDMSGSVMSGPKTLGQRLYRATVDVLPEMGGMVGGTAGALLTRSPAGVRGGAGLGQQAIQSMLGAGLGGATGEAGKQAILNQPSVTSLLRSGVEQAVYDGFGNLVFTYGGKAYRFTKDQFKTLTKSSEVPDSAIKAAQELLLEQKLGATLTPYQATGNSLDALKESIARGSFTGKPVIVRAEQNVEKALDSAKKSILDDISKEVFDGVSSGIAFKDAIEQGESALKSQVRPFYEALDQQAGQVGVNIANIKKYTSKELQKPPGVAKLVLSGPEKELLEGINNLPENIPFTSAHELLSSFKAQLRDAKSSAVPDSRTVSRLSAVVKSLEAQMDAAGKQIKGSSLAFNNKMAADGATNLTDQYKLYSKFYREGLEDLFSDTTSRLLNKDPEKVGEAIFQAGNVTAFKDVAKALKKAQELNPNLNVSDTINSVRRGYLETLLKKEDLSKLYKEIDKDPKIRRTFQELLTKDQRSRVRTLLLAAQRSADIPSSPGGLFFAAQQATATAQFIGAAGGAALFLAPDALPSIAQKNPGWTTAIAGTIVFGPRFLAKAATSPEATNAALRIVRMKDKNIAMSGPLLLKTLQAFDKAGIQPEDLTGETDIRSGLSSEEEDELQRLESELGR